MTNTLCSLPWRHLATHPHGGVSLCCVADLRAGGMAFDGEKERNLHYHSIDQIMNAGTFRKARLQMLNGERPEACLRCYQDEDNGIRSKRQMENERHPLTVEEAIAETKPDGSLDPMKLTFIELRLGNLCNVKCRSCNPYSSTKWIADHVKLEKELDFVPQIGVRKQPSWPDRSEFWSDLVAQQDVEMIYINGGEPTLIQKHWDYLSDLVSNGRARDITLLYNINATNLPEFAFPLWKEFKKVIVSCSIDDLGARNALIRSGTVWADVETNLDRLQQEPWIETTISQTISWMNVLYLGEFNMYMKQRKLWVQHNFVYNPNYLAAWILPEHVKIEALNRAQHKMSVMQFETLRNQLFEKPADPKLFERGMAYTKALDRLRSETSEEVFPELFELLKREI